MAVAAARAARPRRRPYLAITALMAAIVVAGFWPTYFGAIVALRPSAPPAIHLHAALSVGWLAVVGAQAWLAAGGRLALHRRVGNWAFAYGAAVALVGWATALDAFARRVAAGDLAAAKAGLYVPATDLLFFVPALAAAHALRHRPEAHKRLVVVASTALLIAASHRLVGAHLGRPPPLLPVLAVWLSPIALGMAHDWATRRLVHPAYLAGVAMVLAMKFRPRLQGTTGWDAFATWLAGRVA